MTSPPVNETKPLLSVRYELRSTERIPTHTETIRGQITDWFYTSSLFLFLLPTKTDNRKWAKANDLRLFDFC